MATGPLVNTAKPILIPDNRGYSMRFRFNPK